MTYQILKNGSFSIHQRVGKSSDSVDVGPTHENPGFEVSFIGSGTLEFELEGRDQPLIGTSGSALVLPPGLLNTPRGRGTGTFEQVLIAPNLVEEAKDALGSEGCLPDACAFDDGETVSAIARAITCEHSRVIATRPERQVIESTEADLGMEALIQALIFNLVRARDRMVSHSHRHRDEHLLERGIRRAVHQIAADFAKPLTIEDLAKTAGLSRFVFLRKFRAQVGVSPYRYLTNVRLDHAAKLLRRGSSSRHESVLAVAFECGFADPSRFAKMFAARFGATPRVWRNG